MHKLSSRLLSLSLAATLLLTGCSNNSEDSAQTLPDPSFPQAAGATQSDVRSTSSENAAKEHQGPQPTLANSGEGANAQDASGAAANPDAQSGSNTYPNGDAIASTDCYDFPANLDVNVGDSISCAFAAEMYKAAISVPYVTGPSNGNVTSVPKAHITVASPTTGQNYAIKCYFGSDHFVLTCQTEGSSSQSASVSFTPDSRGYWQQQSVSIN